MASSTSWTNFERLASLIISFAIGLVDILITANQPFGEWGKIFPDPAMALAAVDRFVHHATIFESKRDSYRRRAAV